ATYAAAPPPVPARPCRIAPFSPNRSPDIACVKVFSPCSSVYNNARCFQCNVGVEVRSLAYEDSPFSGKANATKSQRLTDKLHETLRPIPRPWLPLHRLLSRLKERSDLIITLPSRTIKTCLSQLNNGVCDRNDQRAVERAAN